MGVGHYKADYRRYTTMPGKYLKEVLESRNISQSQLSRNMGVSKKLISEIISGKNNISAKTALGLEKVLGQKATFWMKLDTQYQLHLAYKKNSSLSEGIKGFYDHDHYILSWSTEGESPEFALEEFQTLDEAITRAIALNHPSTSCPHHIQNKDGMIFINSTKLFELMDEKKAGSGIKAAE